MRPEGILRRWLTPSLLDCLPVSLLVWQFAAGGRWLALLADGDTGWHIRTGEYVLATGSWPRHDLFSFSKPGQPWFAWEWLSDVILALAHRAAGLGGVVVAAACAIVLAALVLVRRMINQGANAFVAMIVLMLALGAASIHFLARPHVFTLLLWSLAWAMIERDRERRGAGIWWLVPLTVIWVNAHGGFVALLASLALLAAGVALEAWLAGGRWPEDFRPALRYGVLLGACTAASLINPYGWRLHAHIASYLRSDWIRNVVDEFQSPKFRSEYSLYFELILFVALMAVPSLLARQRVAEALLGVFWAHAALVSARHVPLFVFLVAPQAASWLSALWERASTALGARSVPAILGQVSADLGPGFARLSAWAVLGPALVVAATPEAHWPRDFPAAKFPVAIVERHKDRLAGSRVFTSDQWADYLIYRFYPTQRVYFDGRSDFYGPDLGNEYLKIVQGKGDWRERLARWDFRFALVPTDWPLAALLESSTDWELVEKSRHALLFRRMPDRRLQLKKSPGSAEL
ncbi:MAG: hypothetical protein ACP5U2_05455 [Bryobacteraceae bacterium]